MNVQVFVAVVIAIKTIAEFATTFGKECRTLIKERERKRSKNCEKEWEEMENIENKKHKRLSVAELKNCKGFENYTDEQAEETIKSLEKLSILFYELYMKQKQMKQKLTLIKGGEIYESEQRTAA